MLITYGARAAQDLELELMRARDGARVGLERAEEVGTARTRLHNCGLPALQSVPHAAS